MARTDTLGNFLTDVADAIREKKGTTDTILASEFDTEISSIETGGTTPMEITFCDYDGTELYKIPINELAELPPLPEHEGLVCQGWNWDLEDIINENKPLIVGANYVTDNGETRIYVTLTEGRSLDTFYIYINATVNNGMELDWGDGTDVIINTNTYNTTYAHKYEKDGEYVVRIRPLVDDVNISFPGNNSSSTGYASSSLFCTGGVSNGTTYKYGGFSCINKIEIGSNVSTIASRMFQEIQTMSSLTIPVGVTLVDTYAFTNGNGLRFLALPKGVTSIGNYAFSQNESIHTVSLPKGLETIGQNCFNYAYNLTNIVLPSTVTTIGASSFSYTSSLTSIDLSNNTNMTIGGSAFSYSGLKELSLPSNWEVGSSGSQFRYCRALQKVNIPEGITILPPSCFDDCETLETISLPSSLLEIGGSCFYKCYKLSDVVLPENLEKLGSNCFSYCYGITSINIPNSKVIATGSTFNYCYNLVTVEGIEHANESWFINDNFINTGLKEFTIPEHITTVGSIVSGQSLRTFNMSNNITSITTNPYGSNPSIALIKLPAKLNDLNMNISNFLNVNVIDFTDCEKIPELNSTWTYTTFISPKILLPSKLYDGYEQNPSYNGVWFSGWFEVVGEYISPMYNNTIVVNEKIQIGVDLTNYETIPEVRVTSDITDGITIDNIIVSTTKCMFDVLTTMDNIYNITVTVNGNTENIRTFTLTSINEAPVSTYNVENIEELTYGFTLLEDGYYESNNSNKINTYAICNVHISNPKRLPVYIDYIYHVGGSYGSKPAIFSQPNKDLGRSMYPDKTNVYYKIPITSAEQQTLEYVTDLSDYYISVKFSNNQTSSSQYNNSLRFKIRFGDEL